MTSGWLTTLGFVIAIGALAACLLRFRVANTRNHPESYVVALALTTTLAALRAQDVWRPAGLALGFSSLVLIAGAWFNFVVAWMPV
jgi:hypothetical protein